MSAGIDLPVGMLGCVMGSVPMWLAMARAGVLAIGIAQSCSPVKTEHDDPDAKYAKEVDVWLC